MKHHFGDFLDRSGGHWTFVPNVERHAYHLADLTNAQSSTRVLTMSKADQNWELIAKLPKLEELTLHEPSADQLSFVSTLWRLKRLRVTHAQLRSIETLARLQNVEELILEYVSGFDDISPLGKLRNLRALHLENLRRISDFSPLGAAPALKYLSIDGTLDWAQPVESFEFVGKLTALELFRLGHIRCLAPFPALIGLTQLKSLTKIRIPMNLFPLEEYALLEARLGSVPGACFQPYKRWAARYVDIPSDDIRSRVPEDQLAKKFPEVLVRFGVRQTVDPESESYFFLGKRAGSVKCLSPHAEKKCAAYTAKYRELVEQMKSLEQ